MDQSTQSIIVSQCSQVQLWRFQNNQRMRTSFGTLTLALLSFNQKHFLNIDTFYETIQEMAIVFLEFDDFVNLIFPHPEAGLNVLSILKKDDSKIFLQHLQQISYFIPYSQAIQKQEFNDIFSTHCKDIEQNPTGNEGTAIHIIQKTGESLKSGFQWLGTIIGFGIVKGQEYLISKIDKKEEIKISEETKQNVEKVKNTLNISFQVASALINQFVINPISQKGVELTQKLNDHIDKSQNPGLEDVRRISIAAWQASGLALQGLGCAANEVTNQLSESTTKIIGQKYGDQAVNTLIGPKQASN